MSAIQQRNEGVEELSFDDSGMKGKTEEALRLEMIEIGRLMYEHGLIAGTDGNLSIRLGKERILATPSGVAKGRMKADDLVLTDLSGKMVAGRLPVSSEIKVHLAAYRLRPDISAVLHAHPPASLALSLAGVEMDPPVIAETVLSLGPVVTSDYETPGSSSLAEKMESALLCHDAMIMERHGALVLGRDLYEAYNRMESLEHTARTLWMARSLGPVKPLPPGELERLRKIAKNSGAGHPAEIHPACRQESVDPSMTKMIEDLVREVILRVRSED